MRALMLVLLWLPFAASCNVDNEQLPPPLERGKAVDRVPGEADAGAHYVIYLHGKIVEDQGARAIHPRFGPYEYQKILDALGSKGFVVISDLRPSGADVRTWAERVRDQVEALIAEGVPESHIGVVGFSKGGAIAILSSSLLQRDGVSFAFLAACGPWIRQIEDLNPRGRLLSIRERSDELADSCLALQELTRQPTPFKEIELELGGGHGAFFKPHAEWVDPVAEWMEPTE
jgi:hypothetical protein